MGKQDQRSIAGPSVKQIILTLLAARGRVKVLNVILGMSYNMA